MKRFGMVVALLALAAAAFGQVDKKVEKELQAGYRKVVAALKKKDVKGVMSRMTPDATLKEGGRTMTRKEFEAMLRQTVGMMEVESSSIRFTKLAVKGNTAKGEYTETARAKMKSPDGKTSLMETVSKYRATFKKQGGDWKLHRSETLGTPTMKMDGKPVVMPAAP